MSAPFRVNYEQRHADNISMKVELMPVIKAVVSDPKVIFTTVFIFIYIAIIGKVVRYRKKPKPIKVKKTFAPPPPAETSGEGGGEAAEE